jgi:aromatic ring-opening dioxygenase catalytic subunit (LigB family)
MASSATISRQPVLFLPHGGGPCFFMDGAEQWSGLEAHLRTVQASLPQRPRAILIVSGHWETTVPTLLTNAQPTLYFDYYGFPDHTYTLQYPVPSAPDLAQRVRMLLNGAGWATEDDAVRGLDHGVFVPCLIAFPDADIPILEMSILETLDPATHLRLGAALAPLRDENVLIVTTGMTYHNLRQFRGGAGPVADPISDAFDAWLADAVTAPEDDRNAALSAWDKAPGARLCHPREEHLVPLMVAAGAAEHDTGVHDYRDVIFGKALSGFRFG